MSTKIYYISFLILLFFACKKTINLDDNIEVKNHTIDGKINKIEIVENKVLINEGKYTPLYGDINKEVYVKPFYIDIAPVTNASYLLFVKSNPHWRKSNVKKIFADGNYLRKWLNDTTLGEDMLPNSPVTNVSWFAAKAYCEATNSRLPYLDEWEYVAMSNKSEYDARTKPEYNQSILNWYEKQDSYKHEIEKSEKNLWGVYDMHGLVWEWVEDFNGIMLSGENRGDAMEDKNLFCASGALGASDLMNYAAFMRYAFRSSLKANYNVQNLGFRTAKEIQNNKQ